MSLCLVVYLTNNRPFNTATDRMANSVLQRKRAGSCLQPPGNKQSASITIAYVICSRQLFFFFEGTVLVILERYKNQTQADVLEPATAPRLLMLTVFDDYF